MHVLHLQSCMLLMRTYRIAKKKKKKRLIKPLTHSEGAFCLSWMKYLLHNASASYWWWEPVIWSQFRVVHSQISSEEFRNPVQLLPPAGQLLSVQGVMDYSWGYRPLFMPSNLKLRNTRRVHIQIRDGHFPMVKTVFVCLVTAAIFSSTKSPISCKFVCSLPEMERINSEIRLLW